MWENFYRRSGSCITWKKMNILLLCISFPDTYRNTPAQYPSPCPSTFRWRQWTTQWPITGWPVLTQQLLDFHQLLITSTQIPGLACWKTCFSAWTACWLRLTMVSFLRFVEKPSLSQTGCSISPSRSLFYPMNCEWSEMNEGLPELASKSTRFAARSPHCAAKSRTKPAFRQRAKRSLFFYSWLFWLSSYITSILNCKFGYLL